MPRYDLKMIPDQLGLDQEFSESLKFTIFKFPPPSMPMPPTVLDLIPSQMRQFEKAGKLIIQREVVSYLSECLELEVEMKVKDCFVTTGSRIFVIKGIPLVLSRIATGRRASAKVVHKHTIRMFFVRVGQGAPEYSLDGEAPADLDDVVVGTPGSAARRREKRTVAPYRSYEVKASLDISIFPSTLVTFESLTPNTQGKEETPRKSERRSARFSEAPSYRSFAVDEPALMNPETTKKTKRPATAFEYPLSPSRCNKRMKMSTSDDSSLNGSDDVKSGFQPLKKALIKIRGRKSAKVSSIKKKE
ncbi:hypothetical protein F5876DRAFT_80053 [Lentinula aff. lateritia]|uniref:Uncharacterized protein n=1 Tax=Lentinula aff. lateritia TaxID=2804960 RepID=A0ACC1TQT2_9AGAR|nr:hypothetical protein F5876DRAFT_80053 [Lentinula aff. lateritia]